MNHKISGDISFQVTGMFLLTGLFVCSAHFLYKVNQLTLPSQLAKEDIRVTICVNKVSKITCSGEISEDGLTVLWNHPFLL